MGMGVPRATAMATATALAMAMIMATTMATRIALAIAPASLRRRWARPGQARARRDVETHFVSPDAPMHIL